VDNPEGFDSLRLTEDAQFDLNSPMEIKAHAAGKMKVWIPLEEK